MTTARLAIASVVCLTATAFLALVVAHGTGPYGFEDPAIHWSESLSSVRTWSDIADLLGTPTLVVVFAVCLGIGQAKGAVLRVVLYALLAVATIVISDHIVKQLVDRTYYSELTFPSGHVTAASATAFAMWLGLYPLLGKWARNAVLILGAGWVLLTTVAVVGGVWHTPLDAVGAALLSVGVVAAGAAVLESRGVRDAVSNSERRSQVENAAVISRPSVEELLGPAEDPVGVAQAQGINQEKG